MIIFTWKILYSFQALLPVLANLLQFSEEEISEVMPSAIPGAKPNVPVDATVTTNLFSGLFGWGRASPAAEFQQ